MSSFQCSVTCERGTQKRFFKCAEKYVSGKYRELASKKCLHLPQPQLELQRACAPFPCPKRPAFAAAGPSRAGWFASPWSQVGMKGGRRSPSSVLLAALGGRFLPECSPQAHGASLRPFPPEPVWYWASGGWGCEGASRGGSPHVTRPFRALVIVLGLPGWR